MPDPVIHFIVPTLALLAISRPLKWDPKHVLLLAPVTVLPDLDVFVDLHHGLGHNVFLFLPFLAIYVIGRRRGDAVLKSVAIITALFYASHLVFDFFQAGLIPLYPIDTTWVKLTGTLHLDGIRPVIGLETEFTDVPTGGRSPARPLSLISPNSLGVAVFSVPVMVYVGVKEFVNG